MTYLAAEQNAWAFEKQQFGVDATYKRTPGGGEAVTETITVLLHEDSGLFTNDPDVERFTRLAIVDLDISPGFTIEPRGTLTIGDDIWQVLKPSGRDRVTQSWKLGIARNQALKHGNGN